MMMVAFSTWRRKCEHDGPETGSKFGIQKLSVDLVGELTIWLDTQVDLGGTTTTSLYWSSQDLNFTIV
jgi:hypothetical protein